MSTPSLVKVCYFSSCYAHPGDLLAAHLQRVAEQARNSIAPSADLTVRDIGWLAGLLHDLGKATPFFQQYLLQTHRRTPLTPHAQLGALCAWWASGRLDWPLWQRLALFAAVLHHHGRLKFDHWHEVLSISRQELEDSSSVLNQQLASLDWVGIRTWLNSLVLEYPHWGLPAQWADDLSASSVAQALLDRHVGRLKLRRAFSQLEQVLQSLAGFGALLACDKLDSALPGHQGQRLELAADVVTRFWQTHPVAASALNQRRTAIAREVCRTWLAERQRMLFSLTAPTGSGKTLAIFHAALQVRAALAEQQGYAPRLIYCLPFTSVIEQNYAVFSRVLHEAGYPEQENLLLKHHHLVDGRYRTQDQEHAPDGAGQLLTETWQSEIVVTTFHQLLHSLLSAHNADLKRAGQLSGSLILLDEVQALPLRYWQALREIFLRLGPTLGARCVLLTATRPLILRQQDACELLPSHAEHFQALERVYLYTHHRQTLSLEVFATQLIEQLSQQPCSTLVILNRRRSVRELFERLYAEPACAKFKLIALSTDFTARDRRARIRLIQRLQRQGQLCVVIATQLVEAGVDISFPVVHRDLAPLDALVQSAGRCNRHASAQLGEVHLWQLLDGQTQPLWRRIYDAPLIEATLKVLGTREVWRESEFLALSEAYFHACWHTQDQQSVDEWLIEGSFQQLERDFQLIEQGPPQRAWFIQQTAKDQRLWQQYQTLRQAQYLSPLEREKQFRRFRTAFYERIVQVYGVSESDEPIECLESAQGGYQRTTGFISATASEPTCLLF